MLITRHFRKGDADSTALYSPCTAYRYLLTRRWGEGGLLLYIMLNPSTATEERNDPTIERCERRARMLGHGGFAVANLFGFRATYPEDLRVAADPVGAGNDAVLMQAAGEAAAVLCGWGTHGALMGRGAQLAAQLRAAGLPLCHLGLTRDGHPRHPLYVGYAVAPQPWA